MKLKDYLLISMKKSVNNKDLAIIGQYLGVVEEFLPNKQSTFIKDGEIFATKSGTVSIDKNRREIQIDTHQEQNRKTVKIGDIVIGTVLFLRKFSVGLSFFTINDKLHFNSSYMGNIHVSHISNRYVEKIQDAFQITDIIRSKVVAEKSGEYTLSTTGKNFGVIHADCAICGTKLKKIGFNKLKCQRCGNFEKRKISDDYDNLKTNLRF